MRECYKEKESITIWGGCSQAIKDGELELARQLKIANEVRQREEESKRAEEGREFEPVYFKKDKEFWIFNYESMFLADYQKFTFEMENLIRR